METEQYIEIFLEESREHLQAINDHLLQLEKDPKNLSIVNDIFRSAHTLKGMAATMGFEDITSLTHQMENVLDKIRHNEVAVTSEMIDITFEAVESLEEMVGKISIGEDGKKDVRNLVSRLEQVVESKSPSIESNEAVEINQLNLDSYQKTVITQAKEQGFTAFQINIHLDPNCVLKAARAFMVFSALENMGEIAASNPDAKSIEEEKFATSFTVILLTKEHQEKIQKEILSISEVKNVEFFSLSNIEKVPENSPEVDSSENEIKTSTVVKQAGKSIRVNMERIDGLMNAFGEMIIDRGRLEEISKRLDDKELQETVEHLSRMSETMQSLILTMRMVPVEQVFNRFPRMVRNLAKELHKEIDLQIIGAETELDRTIIDEIGDPLVHLIRNSLDHGVEIPEVRQQNGKPQTGKVTLRSFHSGNHVYIEIEDDGNGINREKVIKKALENGLITSEQTKTLIDEEVYQLILAPGFSTADHVSDISGRGVGLDVVKSKIESLGGTISIESEEGKGSTFSIQLPLTVSILLTLLVKVQQETYAIPISSIMETLLVKREQILHVHGQDVLDYRGNVVPIVSLQNLFELPIVEEKKGPIGVVMVRKGEKLLGLIVDSFIGQKEVVLKSLGNYLKDVYAISGATILGDGSVSLIVDPNALIK